MAKGQKFGGRQKGTPNKDIGIIRDKFREFIEDNIDDIGVQYKKLESAKDKLYFIMHIGEFVLPKLRSTELTGHDGGAIEINIKREVIENKPLN